ncbi:hypothetical protein [Streptomyces sp. NBC_00019]|uniref:hypothetical protein n=1 Tax=Streptomyces sp. NBC_00019 TaxID=2975623 RepID=UPI003252F729
MHIHQAGPVEGWISVAQADSTLALSWNSGVSALILALAELLLLLWLLLRWLVRRQGGRRRAWRRLTRQVRLTRQAFSEPVREFLRFRAAVRQLTRLLTSASTAAAAQHALDGADTAVHRTASQAFGFAVTVRPATRRDDGEVAVRLAGRDVPPPGEPWETDDDPLIWHASAADAENLAVPDEDGAAQPPGTPRVLVPLGLSNDGVVFLDLLRGPRVLSTYGDRKAIRAFVQAAAAYLDLPGQPAEVLVARGVHPRFDGPGLDTLLDSLAADQAPERTRPVVVVCAAPDDEQAARLSELAGAGLLCALVVGPMPVHRWEIRVNSRGRTETPGLGIETDAAPLGPAVARTARRSGTRRQRPQPKGGPARPPGPRPPAGGTEPRPPVPEASGTGGSRPGVGGPEPRHPMAQTPAPGPSPRLSSAPVPGAAAVPGAGPATGGPVLSGRSAAPGARPTVPRGAPPAPAPEPLAPAVRDLFAEPEITGVSAAGTPDAESFENPRAERRNES